MKLRTLLKRIVIIMKKIEKLKEVNKLVDEMINDLEMRLFIKDNSIKYNPKTKIVKKRDKKTIYNK